ncbi:hypothetical protein KFU94_07650 [Chloroflexi bacterium TSY]|nr:hypothetical protein [Chloroflexi bacterium TSY]
MLHSGGQGGMGKTTLLKMFEEDCQASAIPVSTFPLYFTGALPPVSWLSILDQTVERLGSEQFPKYTQLRRAYASNRENAVQTNTIYQTNIQHVHGAVHSGSGDIRSVTSGDVTSKTKNEGNPTRRSGYLSEKPSSQVDDQYSLTQLFFNELDIIPNPFQLVWLVDAVERLDDETQNWQIGIFAKIAEGKLDRLVLVAAGRDLLHLEPYWIDKVEEILVGNFSEETVFEIVQRKWPTEPEPLVKMSVYYLMQKIGGKPQELITELERFDIYWE